jgi:hypothetical protein
MIWTIPHLAATAWARQHAPWMLDIHPVVPGLVAAIVPVIVLWSKRIEMSAPTMRIFFPERASSPSPTPN